MQEQKIEQWILEVLGQKAYNAYHKHLDETIGKGFGLPDAKPFEELSNETRKAWMEAVKEVILCYPIMSEIDYGDLHS